MIRKLLAYNLYERFKRDCCEPVHHGYTIVRFPLEIFQCTATIVRHSSKLVLKLACDFPYRHARQRIEARLALMSG
ncbi:MAG: hypothetical protein BLM47_05360 [Candidatus Reconcilbacillus cellulovorans]|uniref:Uncharacterized protein n=1 Tax=Candidatus Reconcilbacillus cellulovorans TaxID=1906605 RepID=A0A2A6E198_9BACL|nr:MAG: hypothetical protein BLM47_05360 [Candidatus Reconcilbacillus cellulovorans]